MTSGNITWSSVCTTLLCLASGVAAGAPANPREAAGGPSPYVRTKPCAGEPRSAQFDYWLGEWDVRPFGAAPDGPAHQNSVTLEQDGCVLQEHWQSAPDAGNHRYTGTSFSVFDAKRGVWHQTWVDNVGGLALFEGRADGQGDIVLEQVPPAGGAATTPRARMGYHRLGDGSVRQLVERSTDGGATWTTTIDLHYVRRKAG